MNEREKLVELLKRADDKCASTKQCENCVGFGKGADCVDFLFADYLIANGVIVPPCKVGSKIYMLVTRKTHCFEYPNGKMQRVENQHTFIKETYLTKLNFFKVIDDLGKTVFLTKEEAEKALAEREQK